MEYLKKALNDENKSLVHELTGLKLKYNDNPTIINIQPEDPWAQSRMTRRISKKKKRTVHDYHEVKLTVINVYHLMIIIEHKFKSIRKHTPSHSTTTTTQSDESKG